VGSGRSHGDVAVGAVAAFVVFAAVPGVLGFLVGLPLPHQWSRQEVVSLHGLFDLLAIVAWVAWAACARSLLRAVVQRVRSRDVSDATQLVDRVAVRIAIALLAASPLVVAGAATAGAATPAPAVAAAAATATRPRGSSSASVAAVTPTTSSAGVRLVRPGETLVDLAVAHYEDGAAWSAIARTNAGRPMARGRRLLDPTRVDAGWLVSLPALGADPGARSAIDDGPPETGAGAEAVAPPSGAEIPELCALGVGTLVAALMARRARRQQRLRAFLRDENSPTPRPATGSAEIGVILRPFETVPLLTWVELAMRHLSAVARTHCPLPRAQWVRAGNDGVEVGFSGEPGWTPSEWEATGARSLKLAASRDPAVLGRAAGGHAPWCPVLLPLGEDDRGTWLLSLTAGTCLTVVGPSSRGLVRAMRVGATSWTWRDDLVVTDDPQLADAEASVPPDARPDGSPMPRVLFVGDPRLLSPDTRQVAAMLTTHPLSRAEVTVIVDERAATVHPFGISVRPHVLRRRWTDALDENGGSAAAATGPSVDGSTPRLRAARDREAAPAGGGHARRPLADDGANDTPGDATPPAGARPLALVAHAPGAASVRVAVRGDPLGPTDPAAGRGADDATRRAVGAATNGSGRPEVRLLAPVPSIAGLFAPIDPKRARRALEVIAYLAVHSPDPVTGDRLRTRVLGSDDADAAAKTLFNVVGAARRGLGLGPDGHPLLPPATRTGHYRVSPHVAVDAVRMERLLRAGLSAPDEARRTALLTEGLELVKGEPLAGVLTGYAWWRAEGHERRIADAVVDAACTLARTSSRAGLADLARWAVDQARTVEPYSEALTRASMEVAAARGDLGRLRAEWLDLRRQVDELDPGGSPSEPTERLYAELRERLRNGTFEERRTPTDGADALVRAALT
jgi:hypothetical protein